MYLLNDGTLGPAEAKIKELHDEVVCWRHRAKAAERIMEILYEKIDRAEMKHKAVSNAVHQLVDWRDLSDEGLRLRCGELSAQEVRTIRAVLNAILPTDSCDELSTN